MTKNSKPDSAGPIKKNTKKTTKSKSGYLSKTESERAILLNDAVFNKNYKTVIALLKTKVNINKVPKGQTGTPLTNACRNGSLEIVRALIKAGADVNLIDKRAERPLKTASNGYQEKNISIIVKILLKNGAKPDLFKKGEDGPLHYAAMFGHFDAVKSLVKYGANVNLLGAYKRTPLIYAAADASSPEMVKFLLDSKAKINAKNEAGENALFELITRDESNAEIAEILIDNGINLHYKNKSYGTALHWAAFCGRLNIVEVLLKKGAKVNEKDNSGETAIAKAMSEEKKDIVKLLFKHGAETDSKGAFGYSLLEFASEIGDKQFVKEILAKQKAKNSKIKKKAKPDPEALIQAAKNGDIPMLKLLIESGTDKDERNKWGSETALMKAAYYGKLKTVIYLLEAGADIKLKDSRGNTAFLHAAWSGHPNVVKELLKKGADINERNKLNWNALMQACVEGHLSTVKFLLEKGSPTDVIDKEKGATALTLAKYSRSQKLIDLLLAYGAKERTIKIRKEGEAYFSIFDCDICYYLPHKKDLERTESPESFIGLETIHTKHSQPDRYTDDTDMVKMCTNCGTYYHHDHSYDDEDAFIAGPSISQNFQRYNLIRLKLVLQHIGKADELKELEKRYPLIITEMESKLKEDEAIQENFVSYLLESLTDYYITRNDWKSLNENILQYPDPQIVLDTAKDLVLMYGERFRRGVFPSYTNYRDFTEDMAKKAKVMLKKHLQEFMNCILKFEKSEDEKIKYSYKSVMDSAKYYKLFEA